MHTRGRHNNGGGGATVPGTTHAHAGQTDLFRNTLRKIRNHPYARGADFCTRDELTC